MPTDTGFAARLSLRSCAPNYRSLVQAALPLTTNQITKAAMNAIIAATDQQIANIGKETVFQRIIGSY